MTRIQWGSISGKQGSVTELSVSHFFCFTVCTVCISLPHYTLSFTVSPSFFLCFSFSLSFSHVYTTYHCYKNILYQLNVLTDNIFSADADNTKAHIILTKPLEHENMVLANCFSVANRILINKFNDA